MSRLTDTKKYRNLRTSKEKFNARCKLENKLGVFTGVVDKNNTPIYSGDKVKVLSRHNSQDFWYDSIVLYDVHRKVYACLHGCWYGDQNEYDPRCYGKIDCELRGTKVSHVEVTSKFC